MPNLRLTDVDVRAVLGYIAEESARLARALQARAGGAAQRHGDHHAGHHAHHGAGAGHGPDRH